MPPTNPAESDENRVRWIATFTLGFVLAAHTLLETGRDALFLANIPAERLPWVYIALAFLALWVVRLASRSEGRRALVLRLVALQLAAAVSVLGFWSMLGSSGPWLYYALYIWSGVISSAVVVSFWTTLGDLFTITQGKRYYASIAVGGSLGALAGAGLATALTPSLGAEPLLLASAALFALSAAGPVALPAPRAEEPASEEPAARGAAPGLREGIRLALSHPYAVRVATLVVLASATLTLGDYLFKSVLAHEVPAADLSTWLARIYLGLNLLSIAMLLVGVTPSLRRLGVDRSLALLPVLIGLSILGVFAGLPLFAIVLLKASDGTLRYSLHKTATELLYLPMPSQLRASVKGVIDLAGSSAAKALASVAILLLVTTSAPRLAVAAALLLLAAAWAWSALKLRRPYLDVFRGALSHGSIETRIEYPELDVASVGSLIRALGDHDDRAVIAAMDLLVERDAASLIPSLILYHPSPQVVARAVEIFTNGGHQQVLDFSDRLLEHEYASVRSAIVRALATLAPDREHLEELSRSTCPCIRVSAVAGLMIHGWADPGDARHEFREALEHPERDTRLAVAHAAKLRYAEVYRETLPRLARDPDLGVAREAVRAMAASGDSRYTSVLVGLLNDGRIRDLVQSALLARGDEGLQMLSGALVDPDTPASVARHIPRSLARFASWPALEALLRGLGRVRSGMVRYKILRALQPLLAGPVGATADKTLVFDELEATVERALFLLRHEVELSRGHDEDATRGTTGGRILVDVLRDKRELAMDRIFLLVALIHPGEDSRRIRSGLISPRATRRASAMELLENLVPGPLRRKVSGLVATGGPAEQLRAADPEGWAERIEYGAAVSALARDSSNAVRAFALYHAGEIALEVAVEPSAEPPDRLRATLRERALGIIERLPEALSMRARSPGSVGAS